MWVLLFPYSRPGVVAQADAREVYKAGYPTLLCLSAEKELREAFLHGSLIRAYMRSMGGL